MFFAPLNVDRSKATLTIPSTIDMRAPNSVWYFSAIARNLRAIARAVLPDCNFYENGLGVGINRPEANLQILKIHIIFTFLVFLCIV